jgi:hypothetical protein
MIFSCEKWLDWIGQIQLNWGKMEQMMGRLLVKMDDNQAEMKTTQ